MITDPTKRPENLNSIEVDFGTTISGSIWKKVRDLEIFINDNLPIGLVIQFHASQQYANGLSIDLPGTQWQFCDGTVVSNPESPLLGVSVPDLRSKFLAGDEPLGVFGGGTNHNLSHNHGGVTLDGSDKATETQSDPGFVYLEGSIHNHSVATSNLAMTPLPPYRELQFYMRIV